MSKTLRILVLGKRGGVLRWFESFLGNCRDLPGVEVRPFSVNHAGLADRFWKNLLKSVGRQHLDRYVARQFETVLKTFRPDLVLIVDYFHIPSRIFEILSLQKGSAPVAWWIGDLFDRQKVTQFGCVDRYYFTDSYFLDYAAEGGIDSGRYLPLACDPQVYGLHNQGVRDPRLVFVGAYAGNREEILRQVEQPMLIVGKRWDSLAQSQHEVLARRVAITDVARYYNRHVGVLNIKNSGNVVNGLNMRTFDAPACGSVVLNDALADLENCFEIGQEILVYRDVDELNELSRRIGADPPWRTALAEAGRRRVMAEHLYRHRIVAILEDLVGVSVS